MEFEVKTGVLKNVAGKQRGIQTTLQGLGSSLDRCQSNLQGTLSTSASASIRRSIRNVHSGIGTASARIGSMGDKLNQIASLYESAEKEIMGQNVVAGKVEVAKTGTATMTTVESLKNIINNWKFVVPSGVFAMAGQSEAGKAIKEIWTEIQKTKLDVLGNAGTAGSTASLLIFLGKKMIEGKKIESSDYGKLVKATGKSIQGIVGKDGVLNFIKSQDKDYEKFFGLNAYSTISTDSAAAWSRAGVTAKDTFKSQFSGAKAAGWALSLAANGVEGYVDYKDGKVSGGRAVANTVVRTGVDIAKGAALTAAVAAGFAMAGVAAPALAVAGTVTIVSAGLDFVCKRCTDKTVTQLVSDGIIDGSKKLADMGTKAYNKAKDVVTEKIGSIGEKITGAVRATGAITSGLSRMFAFGAG